MDVTLLQVIRNETRPVEGHTDPGAIADCWDEAIEQLAADTVWQAESEQEISTLRQSLIERDELISALQDEVDRLKEALSIPVESGGAPF